MNTFTQELIGRMHDQLEKIHSSTTESLEYAKQAVALLLEIMEELKAFTVTYKFKDKGEEITFFKVTKPQFTALLLYYNGIYQMESGRPFGNAKTVRKYFQAEQDKLKTFFTENAEFCRYLRMGNQSLDEQYFLRGQHDIRLMADAHYFTADHRFSTTLDFKMALIKANGQLDGYLEAELSRLQLHSGSESNARVLKWTGSKVGIIELIYALHTEGVFNHGSSDLGEIVLFFGKAFEIDLGQFHRTFFEISARKSERTKFLNTLMAGLVKRMDDRDAK